MSLYLIGWAPVLTTFCILGFNSLRIGFIFAASRGETEGTSDPDFTGNNIKFTDWNCYIAIRFANGRTKFTCVKGIFEKQ